MNKADEAFNAQLGEEMARRTDKLNDTTIAIAERVRQAREFLAWSASHTRESWLEWAEESEKAMKDVIQLRMALDRETKAVTATMKDLRDFYNSAEYRDAHARMDEMIGMLDKFQKLKANGTLDAFADFILKVSC